MILDWRGKEIVSSLDKAIFENKKAKSEFYDRYSSSLEKIVGFKPEWWKQSEAKDPISFFNLIEAEFKQHSFVVRMFGENHSDAFPRFFNSFFIHPYGISYDSETSAFVDQSSNEKPSDDRDHQYGKITAFVRTVNLPLLFNEALKNHTQKYGSNTLHLLNSEILWKQKPQIVYQEPGREELKGFLRPSLPRNLWYTLFSSSDDCIFIKKANDVKKAQENVIFQQYWFASLLHQFHHSIYYLDFEVEEDRELKDLFPYHFLRLILFDCSPNQPSQLLVEGLLGSNFKHVKKVTGYSSIDDFVDCSLWKFSETFHPGGSVIYGFRNKQQDEKTHFQFDQYIRRKYGGIRSHIRPPLPVKLNWNSWNYSLISNVDSSGNDLYDGKQFSEIVAYSNPACGKEQKQRLGSFVNVEGKVSGIAAKRYIKEKPISVRWNHYNSFLLLAIATSGFYAYTRTQRRCIHPTRDGAALVCDFEDREKRIYVDEINTISPNKNIFVVQTTEGEKIKVLAKTASEKENVRKVIDLKEEVRKAMEYSGIPCLKENISVTTCIKSQKIIARVMGLLEKYEEIRQGLSQQIRWTLRLKAYDFQKNEHKMLNLIDFYSREQVMDIFEKVQRTEQSMDSLESYIGAVANIEHIPLRERALELVEYYVDRWELYGLEPAEKWYDSVNKEWVEEAFDIGETRTLECVKKVLEEGDADESLFTLNLMDKYRVHPYSWDVACFMQKISNRERVAIGLQHYSTAVVGEKIVQELYDRVRFGNSDQKIGFITQVLGERCVVKMLSTESDSNEIKQLIRRIEELYHDQNVFNCFGIYQENCAEKHSICPRIRTGK